MDEGYMEGISLKNRIAVSSACFQESNIEKLCELIVKYGFASVELTANLSFYPEKKLIGLLKKYKDKINFQVHNYFPIPDEPFVLNLGHPSTVAKSVNHCKKAIDFCKELGIKHYSVHAGIAFDPKPHELGGYQLRLPSIKFAESRRIFINACLEVAEYACGKQVLLLVENNLIQGFNAWNGINDRCHFTDIMESENLLLLFDHSNIRVLLDFAHLKVSAQTLNFDPKVFLQKFKSKIVAVHLSDNDGLDDQNNIVTNESWFWNFIPWNQIEYISLEITGVSVETLHKQVDLVRAKVITGQH